MKSILDKLGIDETYTKEVKKPKYFTKIKDNIPLVADMNVMADLIMLPTTKKGYKYLLTVDDLATDEFDVEPLLNKTPEDVLKGLQNIFKRSYVKCPKASISTDAGSEFKGIFHKWFYDHNIYHKVALPNRHSQMSSVESLNKQIERVLNGYMNSVELKTGEQYNEWVDVLEVLRREMNKIRKKPEQNPFTFKYPEADTSTDPKFEVGDIVFRKSDVPLNALGNAQPTNNFRVGDFRYERVPRKVLEVLNYAGKIPYRYMIEGIKNASFTEDQLMEAPEHELETKYQVREIIGKKKIKGKNHYLIWWKNELKRDATYEPEENLLVDGFKKEIDEYNRNY